MTFDLKNGTDVARFLRWCAEALHGNEGEPASRLVTAADIVEGLETRVERLEFEIGDFTRAIAQLTYAAECVRWGVQNAGEGPLSIRQEELVRYAEDSARLIDETDGRAEG